jgi:hypothetical protein
MKTNYKTTIKNMTEERLLKFLDRYESRLTNVVWDNDDSILPKFIYAKQILKKNFNKIW